MVFNETINYSPHPKEGGNIIVKILNRLLGRKPSPTVDFYICKECKKKIHSHEIVEFWGAIYCKKCDPKLHGKDQPIPIQQVLRMDLVFEGKNFDDEERRWLNKEAFEIARHYWPEFVDALAKVKPHIILTTQFVPEVNSGSGKVIKEAASMNANIVIQPKVVMFSSPSGDLFECVSLIAIFLSRNLSGDKVAVLISPNHRIVPDF